MEECSTYYTDPFCFCIDKFGNSAPQYKQYDGNYNTDSIGYGYRCCFKTSVLPSFVASKRGPITTQFSSVIEFLQYIQVYDLTCDYSIYFRDSSDFNLSVDYPDLYSHAKSRMEIYNNFFCKNNYTSITQNDELIPVFTENTVTCPDNFIPQILSYQDDSQFKDQYIYVCVVDNEPRPNMGFPYKLLNFYDRFDNDCKTKTCNTLEKPTIGSHSVGYESHKSNNYDKKTDNHQLTIVLSTVLPISIILLSIFIYYLINNNKGFLINRKSKNEILTEKNF